MIDLQARLSTGYTARQEACAPTPHCPAAHASWPVRGWRRARAARSLAPFNVPRTTHPSLRPRVPPHPATLSEHGPPARATTNDRTSQSRRTDGISRRRMLRPPRAPQNQRATAAPGLRRRPCRRALHRARVLLPRAARRNGRAGSAVISSRRGGRDRRPGSGGRHPVAGHCAGAEQMQPCGIARIPLFRVPAVRVPAVRVPPVRVPAPPSQL